MEMNPRRTAIVSWIFSLICLLVLIRNAETKVANEEEDLIIALYWGGDIIHGDQRGVRYSWHVSDWLMVNKSISYDELYSKVFNAKPFDPSWEKPLLKCRYPITADSSEYVAIQFNSQTRWERILKTFDALEGRTGMIEVFVENDYSSSSSSS